MFNEDYQGVLKYRKEHTKSSVKCIIEQVLEEKVSLLKHIKKLAAEKEHKKRIEKIQPDEIKQAPAATARRVGKLTNIQKIQLIQQTINEQIRPALRAHGGNVELIDVEGNKVVVAFRGMCAKCKMAEVTMSQVVEAKLKEFVSSDLVVEEQKDSSPSEKE